MNICRVAILAFHKALADQPRDPLVVAAFSIAVHSGGSLMEAVKIARKIEQPHDAQFMEVSKLQSFNSNNKLVDEVIDLATSAIVALQKMTDEHCISQALIQYPQAPQSDMVLAFITILTILKVYPELTYILCHILTYIRIYRCLYHQH